MSLLVRTSLMHVLFSWGLRGEGMTGGCVLLWCVVLPPCMCMLHGNLCTALNHFLLLQILTQQQTTTHSCWCIQELGCTQETVSLFNL